MTLAVAAACSADDGTSAGGSGGVGNASAGGTGAAAGTGGAAGLGGSMGGTSGAGGSTTGGTAGTGGIMTDSGPAPFPEGNVYVVGYNDRKVFELDSSLQTISSWDDPSFMAMEGPSGMVFDYRGYLVVATWDQFCVFSAPGVLETCHPKIKAQRTENVIFDIERNLYTTTSTGGTDEIHKYDGDYKHLSTFSLTTGQLTGITCDPTGTLYVASQVTPMLSKIYKVDKDSLTEISSFDVAGNAEGLQYAADGNILVALADGVGIARVDPNPPNSVLSTISNSGLLWPVPLTVDQAGQIYTGDFEDGNGSAASDLFVFSSTGAVVASRTPSELHGPFGMVVAGTVLPCGARTPPS